MNNPVNHTGKPVSHHPMMILAAVAIILFCLAGTAAIMGWLPSSIGTNSSSGELTTSDRAALASSLTESNGNGFNNGAAGAGAGGAAGTAGATGATISNGTVGVEAQRERDRLAMLDTNTAPRRDLVTARERAAAPLMAREYDAEPVRLARAEPVRERAAPVRERAVCSNCGRVESVRAMQTRAQGSGLGAAGGAVLGGLLGNQIGGGNGKKLATVVGAVGGAVVGNQVEGNMKATTSYQVQVRMDNGGSRTFNLQNLNGYNTGDRIKVVNGALRHAG